MKHTVYYINIPFYSWSHQTTLKRCVAILRWQGQPIRCSTSCTTIPTTATSLSSSYVLANQVRCVVMQLQLYIPIRCRLSCGLCCSKAVADKFCCLISWGPLLFCYCQLRILIEHSKNIPEALWYNPYSFSFLL